MSNAWYVVGTAGSPLSVTADSSIPGNVVSGPFATQAQANFALQEIGQYMAYLSKLPGTYEGNYTQYDGLSWSQLYIAILHIDPTANIGELAAAVKVVYAAQQTGSGVGTAESGLAKFIGSAENALGATDFNPAGNIDDLIKWLSQGAIWERVAEVVAGLIILGIGLKAVATPEGQQASKQTAKKTTKHIAEIFK